MRRLVAAVMLSCIAGCTPANAPTSSAPLRHAMPDAAPPALPRTAPDRVAAALVEDLARRDWSAATARFDATMSEKMPPAQVEALWNELLAKQGPFVHLDAFSEESAGAFVVVLADVRFDRRRQRLRVAVDASGKVAGLFHGPVPEDVERDAHELVIALSRGDAASASRSFTATMRSAVPPERLLAAWQSLVVGAGAFSAIERVRLEAERGITTAHVRCRMQRELIVAKVAYDPHGDVAGLWLLPADADAEWSPPPYVDLGRVEQREVRVGSAPALPGTLALPKGARAVPAVVLVHGSGPNDRDETIGPTKVFRDLALGLATRGVAALRYEKRTRVDPTGVVTQQEEVVDGALAAIGLLRSTPEVDPSRVVVVGHSEGGSVAPRIAEADGKVAGIVVMAGATRPLEDAVLAQVEYLRSLTPADAKLGFLVDEAKRFKAAVEDPALSPDASIAVPGGGTIPGAYLLDLRGRHPEKVAASLPCPLLVLQGERDYQVTLREDFEAWRHALSGSPRATLRTFPALDHRFVAGEGPSSPAQYAQPGHVDARVVEVVAAWVSALPAVKLAPGK